MPQAARTLTPPLSRRRFLSTMPAAAGAIALAAAPVAALAARGGGGADAELIDLGARFDVAVAEDSRLHDAGSPLWEATVLRLESEGLMVDGAFTTEFEGRYFRYKEIERETGFTAAARASERWHEKVVAPLAERIMSIEPTTLAGASVRLKVVAFMMPPEWIDDTDDIAHRWFQAHLADINRLAG